MNQAFMLAGMFIMVSVLLLHILLEINGNIIRKYADQRSSSHLKSPEEYRRLAKRALRDKRFLDAEEYYARAKMLEEEMREKNSQQKTSA